MFPMATTRRNAASTSGEIQHSVELAFAVAALQHKSGLVFERRDLMQTPMLNGADVNDAEVEEHPQVFAEIAYNQSLQTAGSGSDSRQDKLPSSGRNSNVSGNRVDLDDSDKRLARSRERNREHARKTRLRKKAQLEALQCKVKGLEAERQVLKQKVEECSIASILLNLGSSETDEDTQKLLDSSKTLAGSDNFSKISMLTGAKRKRFFAATEKPNPLHFMVDGKTVVHGGKTHINWKSGWFCDEDGFQKRLTQDQLEILRRERNRMHAKMTRDRKKCFIGTIEKTIEELEADILRLKNVLCKVSSSSTLPTTEMVVTPMTSPELSSAGAPYLDSHDDGSSVYSKAGSDYSDNELVHYKADSSLAFDDEKAAKQGRYFSLND